MTSSSAPCDIVIPVWNQRGTTAECLESIVRNTGCPFRLILIDNASADETREYLEGFAKSGRADTLIIRNEENLGFVKAVNQGLKASSAPYVCVMNNDTITAPGWLAHMIAFAERHPDAGLLNPQCDGHGDRAIDDHAALLARAPDAYMEMNQCFGYCMLIRRALIEKIGLLDEVFGMGNYDDTDYSMRAGRAGYRCVNVHAAYVYHKKHVSFTAAGTRDTLVAEGAREYFRKWPRHLRVALCAAVDDKTGQGEVVNILRGILYLAREWCWVNLWIIGDPAENRKRIAAVSQEIRMPLHQNLKFNYIPANGLAGVHVLIRLIERSFGRKKRKKYDAVVMGGRTPAALLQAFAGIHKTGVFSVDFSRDAQSALQKIIEDARRVTVPI